MSSSELQSLYQEIILDHQKHPKGVGLHDGAASTSHQINPSCGDEVTLQLHLAGAADGDAQQSISIRWQGHGCAISQASASLLSELAEGLSLAELEQRIGVFREVMQSRGTIEPDEEMLGEASALGGVSKYVARVKCAMLAWVAAEDAISQLVGTSGTGGTVRPGAGSADDTR